MNTHTESPRHAVGAWLLALVAICISAQPALGAKKNSNASSCDGLMRAWSNVPAGSVASEVLLQKIIDRCDPADTDGDGLFDFIEEVVYRQRYLRH